MVSVLTFYSDDPSSNPSEAYCFSVNLVIENNKNKQKEVRVGPFKTKQKLSMSFSSVRSPVGVFRRLTTFLRSHGRPESMTSAATFDDVTALTCRMLSYRVNVTKRITSSSSFLLMLFSFLLLLLLRFLLPSRLLLLLLLRLLLLLLLRLLLLMLLFVLLL